METPVEIRYAGVLVGRAQEVRAVENDAAEFFLFMRDPLPVGTAVQLRSGDRETPARVLKAIEAQDPTQSGMQIRFESESEGTASRWIPTPATANEPAPRALPPEKTAPLDAPVVEVLATVPELSTASSEEEDPEISISGPVSPATAALVEKAVTAAEAATLPVEAAPMPFALTESAAVPEAVPVTVGSSMTDALKNATGSISTESGSTESGSSDAIPVESRETAAYSTAIEGETPPLAKPIAGNSSRRRTKKRK